MSVAQVMEFKVQIPSPKRNYRIGINILLPQVDFKSPITSHEFGDIPLRERTNSLIDYFMTFGRGALNERVRL